MNWETRIHELCRRAITAKDHEVEPILAELKTALHEHIVHTRRLLSAYPIGREAARPFRGMQMTRRHAAANHQRTGLAQFTSPSGTVWDTLPRI